MMLVAFRRANDPRQLIAQLWKDVSAESWERCSAASFVGRGLLVRGLAGFDTLVVPIWVTLGHGQNGWERERKTEREVSLAAGSQHSWPNWGNRFRACCDPLFRFACPPQAFYFGSELFFPITVPQRSVAALWCDLRDSYVKGLCWGSREHPYYVMAHSWDSAKDALWKKPDTTSMVPYRYWWGCRGVRGGMRR